MTKSTKYQNHSFLALIAILISLCLQGIEGERENLLAIVPYVSRTHPFVPGKLHQENKSALPSPPASQTNHPGRRGGLTPRRSLKKTKSSKKRLENAAAAAIDNLHRTTESNVPTSHPQSPKKHKHLLQSEHSGAGASTATQKHNPSSPRGENNPLDLPKALESPSLASTNSLTSHHDKKNAIKHGQNREQHAAYPPAFPAHSAHKLKEIKADLMKASAVPLPADEDDWENWHKDENVANKGEVPQIARLSRKGKARKFGSRLRVVIPRRPNMEEILRTPPAQRQLSQVQKEDIEVVKAAGNEPIDDSGAIVLANSVVKHANSDIIFGENDAKSNGEMPEAYGNDSGSDYERKGEKATIEGNDDLLQGSANENESGGKPSEKEEINDNINIYGGTVEDVHSNIDGIGIDNVQENSIFSGEPLHSEPTKLEEEDEEMKKMKKNMEKDELKGDDNVVVMEDKDDGLNSPPAASSFPVDNKSLFGEAPTDIQKTNVQLGEETDGHRVEEEEESVLNGKYGKIDETTDEAAVEGEKRHHQPQDSFPGSISTFESPKMENMFGSRLNIKPRLNSPKSKTKQKWDCQKFTIAEMLVKCNEWAQIDTEINEKTGAKYYASKNCTKALAQDIVKGLMEQAQQIVGDWNGNEHKIAEIKIKIPEAPFTHEKCRKREEWVKLEKDAKEQVEELTTISAEEMKEFGLGNEAIQALPVEDVMELPLAYYVGNDNRKGITLGQIHENIRAIDNSQDPPPTFPMKLPEAILEERWREVAERMELHETTIVNNLTRAEHSKLKVIVPYIFNEKHRPDLYLFKLLALAKKVVKTLNEGKSVLIMPPESGGFNTVKTKWNDHMTAKPADEATQQS